MSRVAVVTIAAAWIGLTLILAEFRWFRRASMTDRLRRYVPGQPASAGRAGPLSVESFRDVIGPLASSFGDRLVSLLGVNEDLLVKLQRVHAPTDVTAFRVRQAAWAGGAFGIAVLAALALSPPAVVGLLFLLGAPILAFLIVEQQLSSACARRQAMLFAELPVTMEQLGMLLGAGYSLGAALNRLAERGSGVIAEDLRRVANRVRQGLSEEQALLEWAAIADVVELRRLVQVLSLNRQGADLGRLVAEEARATRREAHRRMIEIIERRAQLVWIPVTIATLVPGVMFMAIPFIEAMRNFAAL